MADDNKGAESLLDELGKEMFDTTGGDRWKSGQPLPGEAVVPPAKEAPAKEPVKTETTSVEEGLIAGKWATREEAAKGVAELTQFANQKAGVAEELGRKVAALETALQAVVGVKPAGDVPPEAVDPLEALEKEWGLPKAPIEKALNQKVEQKLQAMFKPIVDRQKADAEIVKQYPDYEKEFDGLLEFLEKNPAVKQKVEFAERQGEYLMAREFAWLQFERQTRAERQNGVTEKVKERKEKKAEEMVDAGVTQTVRSDSRRPPGEAPGAAGADWPDPARMDYLKGMAARGHQDVLWRETIGAILTKQGFPS